MATREAETERRELMAPKRLCAAEHCTRHTQYTTYPYCRTCAHGRYIPAARQRVQSVDQFKTPPPQVAPVEIREPREITIHGISYEVVFSGRDSLRGPDAPGRFGCSLLDSSRVVR